MFGQQDNSNQQNAAIPDQAIDAAMDDVNAAAAPPSDWQHPGTPLTDDSSTPPAPVAAPTASDDQPPLNDLMDIKQQALGQLSPLVQHLDQSPEDKFRTIMMMIQASDDQSKIKDAYAAAQAIPDEKIRAQALLDVINEINYFTQAHGE